MNTLELANALELSDKHPELINVNNRAAAELRRLHSINTDLLEALKDMLDGHEDACTGYGEGAADKARAAIANATGSQP
jgi:hypothetical protein